MSRLLIHLITCPQKFTEWQVTNKCLRDSSASPLKEQVGDTKCRFCKEKHSLRDNCLEVYIEIRRVLCPGQHDAVSYISASNPTHHFRIDHYI